MKQSTRTLIQKLQAPIILGVFVVLGVSAVAVSYLQQRGGVFAPNAPQSVPYAAVSNSCTMLFTVGGTPTPTPSPSNTSTPSPSPTANPVCNTICQQDTDCAGAGLICHYQNTGAANGNCRLPQHPSSSVCAPATASPTPSPSNTASPTPSPTLTPTPSPTPIAQCNTSCSTNADCNVDGLTCYFVPGGSTTTGVCRLTTHPTSELCRAATPSPTPTTTPSSTPLANACNAPCDNNSDCRDSNHVCHQVNSTTKLCRLASHPTSESCTAATGTPVATATNTPQLPQSGNSSPVTAAIIIAGVVVVIIGAAGLLLML